MAAQKKTAAKDADVHSINGDGGDGPSVDDAVPMTKLGEFEGKDVVSLSLIIKKAGDGLSKAIEVTPEILQLHDSVTVVLQGPVTGIKFKEIKNAGVLERVVEVTTENAAIVDESVVAAALAETQKKIDERAGIRRLPFGATDPDPADEE